MMGICCVGTDAHKRAKWRRGLCVQVDQVTIRIHVETYVEMDSLYKESPLHTATMAT
jgi:hypothetical protein